MTYFILRDIFRLALAGAILTFFIIIGTIYATCWLAWLGLQELARLARPYLVRSHP